MERLQAADEGILFWFENHHPPWLNGVMKVVTLAGGWWALSAVVLAAVLAFCSCGRRRTAFLVVAAALLALGAEKAVKYTVGRQRPDVAWRMGPLPGDPSFPSGHALNAMAIYGTLGLTALRGRRGGRAALGVGLGVLVGVSRVYLGVHYPADVLGGWTAGLALALLAYAADERWGDGTPSVAVLPTMTAAGPPDERVTRRDDRVTRP